MLPGRSGCLYHTLLHIISACGAISPMIELLSPGGPRFWDDRRKEKTALKADAKSVIRPSWAGQTY